MNIESLDQKIAKRADEVVQSKIKAFKQKIDAALVEIFGGSGYGEETFGNYGYFEGKDRPDLLTGRCKLYALKLAICDDKPREGDSKKNDPLPWPSILWEVERDKIRKDLLDKMDLMQRLLMTKDSPSEGDVPEDTNI